MPVSALLPLAALTALTVAFGLFPEALLSTVGRPHGGVLAEDEIALDLVLEHAHERLVGAVRPAEAGQVVVGPVVLRRCRVAEIGPHQ